MLFRSDGFVWVSDFLTVHSNTNESLNGAEHVRKKLLMNTQLLCVCLCVCVCGGGWVWVGVHEWVCYLGREIITVTSISALRSAVISNMRNQSNKVEVCAFVCVCLCVAVSL